MFFPRVPEIWYDLLLLPDLSSYSHDWKLFPFHEIYFIYFYISYTISLLSQNEAKWNCRQMSCHIASNGFSWTSCVTWDTVSQWNDWRRRKEEHRDVRKIIFIFQVVDFSFISYFFLHLYLSRELYRSRVVSVVAWSSFSFHSLCREKVVPVVLENFPCSSSPPPSTSSS